MEKYNHLMEWLKEKGHIGKKSDKRYYGMLFTPEKIIGLAVHSLLSHKPRERYYTDGEKIYFIKDEVAPKKEDLTKTQKEDIVREHEMFQILSYTPHVVEDVYGLANGHLRIANFDNCFEGNTSNVYILYLADISRSIL